MCSVAAPHLNETAAPRRCPGGAPAGAAKSRTNDLDGAPRVRQRFGHPARRRHADGRCARCCGRQSARRRRCRWRCGRRHGRLDDGRHLGASTKPITCAPTPEIALVRSVGHVVEPANYSLHGTWPLLCLERDGLPEPLSLVSFPPCSDSRSLTESLTERRQLTQMPRQRGPRLLPFECARRQSPGLSADTARVRLSVPCSLAQRLEGSAA